jgi:serine/threonine protein kinase
MGRVFLVRDKHLGQDLALKLLFGSPGDPEEVQRFKDEFSFLAKIEHPGIARVFDFGYLAGRPYFTSEHIHGRPLSLLGPCPAEEALRWGRDLAEALAYLHRSGVRHLDIKPSNIIVRPEPPRAVLVDFGVFRQGASVPAGRRVEGSLPYLAPEYFRKTPLVRARVHRLPFLAAQGERPGPLPVLRHQPPAALPPLRPAGLEPSAGEEAARLPGAAPAAPGTLRGSARAGEASPLASLRAS